jgi:CHAD domain-containing protein
MSATRTSNWRSTVSRPMPDFPSRPLSARARRALDRASANTDVAANPYRLRRDESTADGLRRAARDELMDAIANLRDRDRDPGTAVHEARKDLKKVRAVLRLTRERLGNDRFRPQNRRLRDAGRNLASARDAEVKLETLGSLADRFCDEAPKSLVAELSSELERELDQLRGAGDDRALEAAAATTIEQIEAGLAEIEDWPLDGRGWSLVKDGLMQSYKSGRAAFRDTLESPTPAKVHEWRKRGKDLWYHLRLVSDAWPEVIGALADTAHELSDLLGDHHDLEVLAHDVRERAGDEPDSGERDALLEVIELRQDELLERAIPIGERLYAEKPPEFKRRMHAYWRSWRSD